MGGGGSEGSNGSGGQGSVHALALAAGLAAAAAAKVYSERERISLKAETSEVKVHENRVRMFMTRDKIFNYFASFQHISKTGRKDMMMTPLSPLTAPWLLGRVLECTWT